MKKALILLILLTLGLTALDVYEFLNMQNMTKQYEEDQNIYHELLNEETKNNETINTLNDELVNLKQDNIDTNKEYQVWMNLNKKVQDLLK